MKLSRKLGTFLCAFFFIICVEAQDNFSGIFQAASNDLTYAERLPWQGFLAEAQSKSAQNYQIIEVETVNDGQQQRFWGIWEKGGTKTQLHQLKGWSNFVAKKKAMEEKGFHLIDVEAYTNDWGDEFFLGIWKEGRLQHDVWKLNSLAGIQQCTQNEGRKNKYIRDVESFKNADNNIQFLAIFHSGNHSSRASLLIANNSKSFGTQRFQREKSGSKLIDVERFVHKGQQITVGLFQLGKHQDALRLNLDGESFKAHQKQLENNSELKLVDLEVDEGTGRLLMPANKTLDSRMVVD